MGAAPVNRDLRFHGALAVELEYVDCNLCGSNEHKTLFRGRDRAFRLPGIFQIVQCFNCGLVFLNPRPTQSTIQIYYPDEYGSFQETQSIGPRLVEFLKTSEERRFLISPLLRTLIGAGARRWLKRSCPPLLSLGKDCRILDVGCGSGRFLLHLRGWDYKRESLYGVDFSPKACEQARGKGLNVFCGQLEEACFPGEFFHVIRLNHVLEHLPDPTRTLKEIRRLIRQDGAVYILVPDVTSILARVFGRRWFGWEVPRHLYGFSRQTLKRLARKGGFEIASLSSFSLSMSLRKSLSYVWSDLWGERWRWEATRIGQLTSTFIRKLSKPALELICLLLTWRGDCVGVVLRPISK